MELVGAATWQVATGNFRNSPELRNAQANDRFRRMEQAYQYGCFGPQHLKNITILDLQNAWREKIPFFMERGLDEPCKKSRKGAPSCTASTMRLRARPSSPRACRSS